MAAARLAALVLLSALTPIAGLTQRHEVIDLHRGRHTGNASAKSKGIADRTAVEDDDGNVVQGHTPFRQLRVCNAYPYSGAMDVFRGNKEKLTVDGPMPYKTCRDFECVLKAGDRLEFRLGDTSAGTFSISDLPNNDAVMLLVIHRHDTQSTAVSFESHVYANRHGAQVAVIDTYRGKRRAITKISDAGSSKVPEGESPRSEQLRYDSVVLVDPGDYEVMLTDVHGHQEAKAPFKALPQGNYVILRTGVEAKEGKEYPQELVVFPDPSVQLVHSGAGGRSHCALMVAATVFATLAGAWA